MNWAVTTLGQEVPWTLAGLCLALGFLGGFSLCDLIWWAQKKTLERWSRHSGDPQ